MAVAWGAQNSLLTIAAALVTLVLAVLTRLLGFTPSSDGALVFFGPAILAAFGTMLIALRLRVTGGVLFIGGGVFSLGLGLLAFAPQPIVAGLLSVGMGAIAIDRRSHPSRAPDTQPGPRRGVVLVIACVVVVGLYAGWRASADRSLFRSAVRGQTIKIGLTPGEVFLYSADILEADADGLVRHAEPLTRDPGLELLDARVSVYKRRGRGGVVYPGTDCTDTWPPEGYGPSARATGFRVREGDWLAFNFYVRAAKPGIYSLEGLDVRYVVGDRGGRYVGSTTAVTLDVRPTPDSFGGGGLYCEPLDSPWFRPPRSGP